MIVRYEYVAEKLTWQNSCIDVSNNYNIKTR